MFEEIDGARRRPRYQDAGGRPRKAMNAQPIFLYDAFLRHRCGDAAAELRTALSAFGCSVWFDENKPLKDRQLVRGIATAFGRARTILGYLSRDIAASPWPLLELRCGLATETSDCERVLFFVPNGVEVDRLGLPFDIVKAVRRRRHYNPETLRELADVLTERNRVSRRRFSRFQDGRQPLPLAHTDRSIIRLRNALECYKQSVAADTSAKTRGPVHQLREVSEHSLDNSKFFIDCAEAILETLLETAVQEDVGGFNQTLYVLRNVVQDMQGESQSEMRPGLVRLVLSIAATFASSDPEDNRANALMLWIASLLRTQPGCHRGSCECGSQGSRRGRSPVCAALRRMFPIPPGHGACLGWSARPSQTKRAASGSPRQAWVGFTPMSSWRWENETKISSRKSYRFHTR